MGGRDHAAENFRRELIRSRNIASEEAEGKFFAFIRELKYREKRPAKRERREGKRTRCCLETEQELMV